MSSYKNMTNDEFDRILERIVIENLNEIMTIPGAYEVFSEHYNNEVLDRWARENPTRYRIPINLSTIKGAKCIFCGKRVSFNHETERRTCCDPDLPVFLGGPEK